MIWLLLILLIPADGDIKVQEPCGDTADIKAYFEFPIQPQNQYTLNVTKDIPAFSWMILRFDSPVTLKLIEPTDAQISKFPGAKLRSHQFRVMFNEETSHLLIQVFGPASLSSIPYVLSVILNNEEFCYQSKIRYFDDVIESRARNADKSCGRRKVAHTELIVHGQQSQPGDWPWHVAIRRDTRLELIYICGGTLLSKTLVLTAAHCATTEGSPIVPSSLFVELGKYNLYGGDIRPQELSVFDVFVHPEFDVKTLNNDIALLKLLSEPVFNDYVQPACFWLPGLPTEEVFGTVVGWGLNEHGVVSSTLQQITIPIVSEMTCLTSDPEYYEGRLNPNKFCAGLKNGTSACNGDSGGGLMIFVPDTAGDTNKASGSWYVRGIISLTRRRPESTLCDPNQYTIFTDVEKYLDWVLQYL